LDYFERQIILVATVGFSSIRINVMKIAFGVLAICYGLALAGCEGGMASNPSTCLGDGSVSWWVTPNKEGQAKDSASMENCHKTNAAWMGK
jgi:hypothetical protein